MNRKIVTLMVVLVIGLSIGGAFLLTRNPGIDAEVVEAPTSNGVVLLCAAPGTTLLGIDSGPTSGGVLLNKSTELLDQRRQSPANFQISELKPGSRVRVWATELTQPNDATNDTPQLSAYRLALLSNPISSKPSLCKP